MTSVAHLAHSFFGWAQFRDLVEEVGVWGTLTLHCWCPLTRKPTSRPGLSKTHAEPLLSRRAVALVKSSDYRVRELFENADVMSEGKVREDGDGAVYYGSTSVRLPFVSRGGSIPDDQAQELLALLSTDPHARVRAIRVACLEAQVRARGPLARVRAELFVHRDARGLRIDVEVEARIAEETSGAARTRASGPSSRRGRR